MEWDMEIGCVFLLLEGQLFIGKPNQAQRHDARKRKC